MASVGVQVLFGFLLALPFSARFTHLSLNQGHLYIVVILLTALATAQLSAPVAYHRLVFRRHRKMELLRAANVLARTGLATVGISICGAVLLVAGVVLRGVAVPLILSAMLIARSARSTGSVVASTASSIRSRRARSSRTARIGSGRTPVCSGLPVMEDWIPGRNGAKTGRPPGSFGRHGLPAGDRLPRSL